MEINANKNVEVISRMILNQTKPPAARVGLDTATFARAGMLEQALQETPVARPEAVNRTRELIGDVKYPPSDAINGIAMLLALHIEGGSGTESHS